MALWGALWGHSGKSFKLRPAPWRFVGVSDRRHVGKWGREMLVHQEQQLCAKAYKQKKHGVFSELQDVQQSCFEDVVQDLVASGGEKSLHWTDPLRTVCRTRRAQDSREAQTRGGQKKKSRDSSSLSRENERTSRGWENMCAVPACEELWQINVEKLTQWINR